MSHVDFNKYHMSCHIHFPGFHQAPCCMLISRNGHVSLLNLKFKRPCNLSAAQQTCQKRAIRSSEKTPREVIEDVPPAAGKGAVPPVELPTDPQGLAAGV